MGKKNLTKIMWFGSDIGSNGEALAPPLAPDVMRHLEGLNRGELYICDNPADPAIFIRLNNGSVVAFRPNGGGGGSFSRNELISVLGISEWALKQSLAFSDMPSMYWADIAVSNEKSTTKVPTFGKVKIGQATISYDETNDVLISDKSFVSMKEVSAWGIGSTGGGGGVSGVDISIVDNLTSTSVTSALSANMGRVLAEMIKEKTFDLTSQAITAALGYTPYDSTNPKGFITGITSKMVTDALGFTPYNSTNFTKSNIKSTLGIADWALNSTKPSYSFSEITGVAAFTQLPTMYWANVAVSNSSNEQTEPTFKSIKIGDGKITWDANGYFVFDNGIVSQSFISAFGVSQGGSEEVSGASSIKYGSQIFNSVDGVIDISSIAISGGVSSWNDLTDKPTWIGSSKPTYNFSEIGSKPTTIGGYGITDALPISGGTMTGILNLKANQYNGTTSYGMNANNSNIIGVNSLMFADVAEDSSEGISWVRTGTTWDNLWANGGILYFTPNYPTETNNHVIAHDGIGAFRSRGGNQNYDSFGDGNQLNGLYYVHKDSYPNQSGTPSDYGSILNLSAGASSWQLFVGTSTNLFFRSRWWSGDGRAWNAWKTFAFTDSNVASASKLQTARTIWGKSFDGTANVSGQMTDVGYIFPVESNKYDIGGNTLSWRYGYFDWVGSKGGNAFSIGANNQSHLYITTGGNFGFGLSNPSYKIHSNGHIYTNGLFLADNISYENNAFVNRGLRCESGYGTYSFFGNVPIIMSAKDSNGYSQFTFGNYAYNSNEWVTFRHKLDGTHNLLNIGSADGSKSTYVGINTSVAEPPSQALDVRGNAKANSFIVNPWANGTTITANGWYKIGRMARQDTYSNSAIIFIGRAYNYVNNENYTISVNSTYTNCTITQISGTHYNHLIDKIGIIGHSGTSGADVYIHISGSTTANQYYISSVGQFIPCTPTLENVTPSTTINTGVGFSVNGNILATGEITAYSDARLKKNVKDLDFRGALSPKSFIKDGKQSIGFIAQEVRELYPELVLGEETEDSYLSLNYGAITAVLACQTNDHERRIAELERENRELKKKLNIN